MAHHINGFIASYDALAEAAGALPSGRICRLEQGLGFMPLVEAIAPRDDRASEQGELDRLTAPMEAWALELSRRVPVAYIETDYFGGAGGQGAIVWKDGEVLYGPIRTQDDYGNPTPLDEGAINLAVGHLGVRALGAIDRFAALGLTWHRSNGDWLEAAESRERGI